MVSSGDDQGRGAEHHQRGGSLSGRDLEVGLLELEACGDERASEDEEDIGKDRSEHGGLHDAKLSLGQGEDADNGLDGVCRRTRSVQVLMRGIPVLTHFRRSARARKGQYFEVRQASSAKATHGVHQSTEGLSQLD